MDTDKVVAYNKVIQVIGSCVTSEQLQVARNMVQNWIYMFYKFGESAKYIAALQGLLRVKYRQLQIQDAANKEPK